MRIAIGSGKGGTGKTLVATNLAAAFGAAYVDCDVEGANGHVFLRPEGLAERPADIQVPRVVEGCTGCGACAEACRFGAIAPLKTDVLVFNELCHTCGVCVEVCPQGALGWTTHVLGRVRTGTYPARGDAMAPFADGELAVGQVRASEVIRQVKDAIGRADHAVFDGPPGCSCAAAEALRDIDLVLLVTEPTPFGLSDLEKALALVEHLGLPHAVILNRADLAGTDVRGFCRTRGIPVVLELPHDLAIARACAEGRLLFGEGGPYADAFERLAGLIRDNTLRRREPGPMRFDSLAETAATRAAGAAGAGATPGPSTDTPTADLLRVAVVSGKGGTGKTTVAASLAALGPALVVADADVDAANLHLLLHPRDEHAEPFSGALLARVDPDACRGCGVCAGACRFDAIRLNATAHVDPLRCEGCGLCAHVCVLAEAPEPPITLRPRLSGWTYVGETDRGPMVRGEFLPGGEASGKLVTQVRTLADAAAGRCAAPRVLIDASPGTGCPVNASLTGCRLAVVVTEPTAAGLHDLDRVLDLAAWFRLPAVVVLNKADLCPEMTLAVERACRSRAVPLLGRVPFDRRVPGDLSRGLVPALGDGPGALALREVCRAIVDHLNMPAGAPPRAGRHERKETA